jgi:L-fuconolactonase
VGQSTHPTPTQYGRIRPPDPAWLTLAPPEPILEPELPIVDTHHHLWQRPDHRYLLARAAYPSATAQR